MYSQEREMKKLRVIVRNKARVEGCIADEFCVKRLQTSQASISHTPIM
jgi:PII-like signaling protein